MWGGGITSSGERCEDEQVQAGALHLADETTIHQLEERERRLKAWLAAVLVDAGTGGFTVSKAEMEVKALLKELKEVPHAG